MRTQRQVVDYSLQKRALLREVHNGKVAVNEVCDASPYLKSAARFHGEPTEDRCPVCRRDNLTLVHYIYGDELKNSAGQARKLAELSLLAMTLDRKSTRLNSSHANISYAVFCLKKKKINQA